MSTAPVAAETRRWETASPPLSAPRSLPGVLLLRPCSDSFNLSPPIGLGYLCSALKSQGIAADILDAMLLDLRGEALRRKLSQLDFDVLGIQVYSVDLAFVREVVAEARKARPDAVIVVGGAHPSGEPDEIYDQIPGCDYGFVGEGEVGLPQLVRALARPAPERDLEAVPGLIWRSHGEVRVNRQAFPDLDALELPDWDAMRPDVYPEAPHGGFAQAFPVAPIVVSRGCPYPCTFCGARNLTGKKMRYRAISGVIEEIKLLIERYGVREIHIEDDNFTMYSAKVEEFCTALLANDIRISWFCASGVRADRLDERVLRLMHESGCYRATIGIESGDPVIIKKMAKQLDLGIVKSRVDLLRTIGFEVFGLFILGYPGETRETIRRTIHFALDLKLQGAQFGCFVPIPATPIYRELVESGAIQRVDHSRLHLAIPDFAPQGMTPRELKWLQRYAFLRFHLRPKILLPILLKLRSRRQLRYFLRRCVDFLVGR